MLRRVVLVLLTMLLVAQPLVLGEDPGLTSPWSGPGDLVLPMLWLFAAVAWAGWRVHARQSTWYGGLAQLGLLLLVFAFFLSAEVAAEYHRPARLIAWSWLTLFLGFCLVRQLAVTKAEQHGLLTALLATCVSLAAFTLYQVHVELPQLEAQLGKDDAALTQAVGRDPGDPAAFGLKEQMLRRARDRHAFGTFAHPNTFASYLILFLPALAGAVWLGRRQQAPGWVTWLTAGSAALAGYALWLTHSRGALLALAAVGALAAVMLGRRLLAGRGLLVGAGAALAALAVALAFWLGAFTRGVGKDLSTASYRLDYWRASWRMILDHPWLGVGPGGFGSVYPQYMAATAAEKVKDPHNFLLEVWAAAGVPGLAALLLFLGAFTWRMVEGSGADGASSPPAAGEAPAEPVLRWEFYVGGMLGLVLGFILRAAGSSPDEIILEGVAAAGRSVVWFVAFAALERLAWPAAWRAGLLALGVLAVFLNLLVSGGISSPSLMGVVLGAAALALNAVAPRPAGWTRRAPLLATGLPLPVLGALLLLFYVTVFQPEAESAATVSRAVRLGQRYMDELALPPEERLIKVPNRPMLGERNPMMVLLRRQVLEPLRQAAKTSPGDAAIPLHLARWYAQAWQLDPLGRELAEEAVSWAQRAQQLDPRGRAGYREEYALRLLFARKLELTPGPGLLLGPGYQAALQATPQSDPRGRQLRPAARKQYELAAGPLEKIVQLDPTEAGLRYELAETLLLAGDDFRGQEQARIGLELDRQAPPPRKLSDRQRTRLERWVGPISSLRSLQEGSPGVSIALQ